MIRALTGPWPIRVMWALLPVVAGPALADALDESSSPVRVAVAVVAWAAWGATLVVTLVPRASSLTALRLAAPAPLVAAAITAVIGPFGVDDALALGAGVAIAALVVLPSTTDAFVDGSSYGSERRFALRTPPGLLVPAAIAWVLAVAAPVAAVIAFAARAWVLGALLVIVAVPGARLGVPAVHRLARRWLVFVPAGVVVHDRMAVADPVLLQRRLITSIRPLTGGVPTDADLRLGAGGVAVSLDLVEPSDIPVARGLGRDRTTVEVELRSLVVAPVRPGAVLREAEARRLPVAR